MGSYNAHVNPYLSVFSSLISACPPDDDDSEPTSLDHGKDVLYTIVKSDTVGRHMVASRDIQPGEIIFTDQAACIGPDNSSKPMCLGCHRKVSGLYKCPGCKWPMCREECTKSHNHLAECAIFQFRKASVTVPWFDKPCSYYDAILPIRVLLQKVTNPKVYRLVSLLMDHKEHVEETTLKHRQRVVDFIRKTCKLGQDFTEEEVHHVLGILSVNSFVVHDTDEDNLDLIGLYPWTSLMSHNCITNTKIITKDDFSYVCEATTFVPAGAEIVTSYHHYHYQLYGTAYRRKDLKSTWSFDCCCPRCADPTEQETYVSAVLCDKCKFGSCLPVNPLDYNSVWRCDQCFLDSKAEDIEEKVKKFETEIDDLKSTDTEEFEKLLRRMRYFLHENHYWILDVKRKLIDIYGNKPGYELYKLPKETLEKKVDFCDHLLSIALKVCPGASEIRGYLLSERHGAQLRLTQWKWIRMRITTKQYLHELQEMVDNLREVVHILGLIRLDSDEGQMSVKARDEIRQLETLISTLTKQTNMISPKQNNFISTLSKQISSTSLTSSSLALNKIGALDNAEHLTRDNLRHRKSICF